MSDATVQRLRGKYAAACATGPWGEAAAVAVLLGFGPIAARPEFARHVTMGGVSWDKVLAEPAWSTGLQFLIATAAGLWTGSPHGADVCRVPFLGDEFYACWLAMVTASRTGKVPGDDDS